MSMSDAPRTPGEEPIVTVIIGLKSTGDVVSLTIQSVDFTGTPAGFADVFSEIVPVGKSGKLVTAGGIGKTGPGAIGEVLVDSTEERDPEGFSGNNVWIDFSGGRLSFKSGEAPVDAAGGTVPEGCSGKPGAAAVPDATFSKHSSCAARAF
jgi:hypothetical protein